MNQSDDYLCYYGEVGKNHIYSIIWHPTDLNPYDYTALWNSQFFKSGAWNLSSDTVEVSLSGLPLGEHNFTLIVHDTSGNEATDSVTVTIFDGSVPIVSHPSDMEFQEGASGQTISWSVSDLHPASYEIYRNGTVVQSGQWNSTSDTISIEVNGLTPGVWNYTLRVIDESGNDVIDTVFVTVAAATIPPPDFTGLMMVASLGGAGAILVVGALYLVSRRKSGVSEVDESQPVGGDALVQVMRGGEFVGNRFRYKVKVLNQSPYVITDVVVTLVSYPRDTLRVEEQTTKSIAKIDPDGFRTPTFTFRPTQDCVKGDISASVSYVDSRGKVHSVATRPFTVRAVCDLLKPEPISPEDFMLKLGSLGHGEAVVRVEDWTPEDMHDRTLGILKDANFFEVESEINQVGEHIESRITGWAKGIYTGKTLGTTITITGRPDERGTTCKIEMTGEDEAMFMPAIDEISQKLGAWLCPRCGGSLPVDVVEKLKVGVSGICPFCNATLDRP